MSKKRAFVRYSKQGKVVPGSLILTSGSFPSGPSTWNEVPVDLCCPSPTTYSLRILFNDITNADSLVGDASNVDDWNVAFQLPQFGNPFTSVVINGNEVELIGASEIYLNELFQSNPDILEVVDTGCIVGSTQDGGFISCDLLTYVELQKITTLSWDGYDSYGFFDSCINLETVVLPSVTLIEDAAFYQCYNLTSVTAPNVERIGRWSQYGAFEYCNSLVTISFPKVKWIDRNTFYDCSSLTSVNLPFLLYLGQNAFQNCSSLVTINLPEVTYVDAYAFFQCTSLTTANLPLVTYISNTCFYNCTSLTSLNISSCTNLGGTTGNDNVFDNIIGNTISITCPGSLLTANYGFPDGDLISASLNNTLIINGSPFAPFTGNTGTLSLTFDNISNANALVGNASNVNDWNTFFDLPSWSTPFTSVTVVGNVVALNGGQNIHIKEYLFQGNSHIKQINDIGCICYTNYYSFEISGLTLVSLPNIKYIEANSFYNCSLLTSFTAPSLEYIGYEGLAQAGSSITTLNFPLLRFVGSRAFAVLPGLTIINIPSCISLGESTGDNQVFVLTTGNTITLTVPSALMTCNAGNPDGDIQYLQSNNTVTVVTI